MTSRLKKKLSTSAFGAPPTLLLLAPACAFLLACYLIPLIQVALLSLSPPSWSLGQYAHIFHDPEQLEVLRNTLGLALGVTVASLIVGYPVAYLLLSSSDRTRRLIMLLILASVWMSILVRTYSWMVLLGRQGPVNALLQGVGLIGEPLPLLYNDFSVYIGMVHILLPFMILPLYSVMQRIDLGLLDNARSLGAGSLAAFWFVFFPLTLPGVLAGSLLVFTISIGFFITPALLGGIDNTTFVMLIEKEVTRFLNWEVAAAMSMVLLAATLALVYLYQYMLSERSLSARTGASPLTGWLTSALTCLMRARAALTSRSIGHRWSGAANLDVAVDKMISAVFRSFAWLVVLFLVVPLLVIFPLSFSSAPFLEFPPSGLSLRWYETVLGRSDWVRPLLVSIQIAFAVSIVATVLGTAAAVALARNTFRGQSLLFGFLLSPIIVPVIVLAVSMHFFFTKLGISGTALALMLGHTVLAMPFVLVVMTGALESIDDNLERVARTLGATWWTAFSAVTLVLMRPAILTSALFAFLASFDELVIALFLSGPLTKTLPKRLWDAIREEINPSTAAVAVLITLVSLCAMVIAEYVRSKSATRRAGSKTPRAEVLQLRRSGLFR